MIKPLRATFSQLLRILCDLQNFYTHIYQFYTSELKILNYPASPQNFPSSKVLSLQSNIASCAARRINCQLTILYSNDL